MSLKNYKTGEERYSGAVLYKGEMNYHDDSDYYAIVWCDTENRLKKIVYDTTRFAESGVQAFVDVTDEIYLKARDYAYKLALKQLIDNWYRDKGNKKFPEIGEDVVVYKGRKVPKGTVGRVFWVGEYSYSYYTNGWRLGITTAKGVTHWTDADNVYVVGDSTPIEPPLDELEEKAMIAFADPIYVYRQLHSNPGTVVM